MGMKTVIQNYGNCLDAVVPIIAGVVSSTLFSTVVG